MKNSKIISDLSLQEAIRVYKKYDAPKWVKFAFKYFSKETEKKNMKLNNAFVWVLGILFGTGMLGTIMHWPRPIIKWVTLSYMVVLSVLVFFLLAAVWTNNRRIRKIAKELGCTLSEWNKIADLIEDEIKYN